MLLSEEDIEKIAALARLKPTAEEKRQLLQDLNKILEYMKVIDEINVEGIPEMASAAEQGTPFREDAVKSGLTHGQALQNAPEALDGFFCVPKVIDTDDTSA